MESIITQDIINAKDKIVGIDIDGGTDLSILMTYFNAKYIADDIKIFKSSSERGYHLILSFNEPLTLEDRLNIREFLGDCEGRLHFSKLRGGDDILFDMKTQDNLWINRREISEETLINPYNSRKWNNSKNGS